MIVDSKFKLTQQIRQISCSVEAGSYIFLSLFLLISALMAMPLTSVLHVFDSHLAINDWVFWVLVVVAFALIFTIEFKLDSFNEWWKNNSLPVLRFAIYGLISVCGFSIIFYLFGENFSLPRVFIYQVIEALFMAIITRLAGGPISTLFNWIFGILLLGIICFIDGCWIVDFNKEPWKVLSSLIFCLFFLYALIKQIAENRKGLMQAFASHLPIKKRADFVFAVTNYFSFHKMLLYIFGQMG